MNDKPISDLRRRMLEDMAVRRLGEKTRHDYIKHIGRDRGTARATLGKGLAVSAFPLYVPV